MGRQPAERRARGCIDGALLQGLYHVVVLGSVMPLVTNWALAWANQLRTLDCQSSGSLRATALRLLILLATGPLLATATEGTGAAVLFPRTLGKGAASAGQHLSCAWRIHGTNLAACRNSRKVTTVKVSNHCLLEYLLRNTC